MLFARDNHFFYRQWQIKKINISRMDMEQEENLHINDSVPETGNKMFTNLYAAL